MTNFWRYLMSIWKLTIKTVFKSSCLNFITIQIQIIANWKEKHTYQHLILLFQRIIITIQICLKLNKVKTLRKTICPTDTWNRWLLKSIQKMVQSKKAMLIVDCRKSMKNIRIMKMKGGKVFMSKIKTCLKCYKVKTSRLKMKVKILSIWKCKKNLNNEKALKMVRFACSIWENWKKKIRLIDLMKTLKANIKYR